MDPSTAKEWGTAIVAFLVGLAGVWATWRLTRRKDAEADAHLGQQTRSDALRECWDFAHQREEWYNKELKEREERIKQMELAKQGLRDELHEVRNKWSKDQMSKVRLEEELKWTKAELAATRHELEQERERRSGNGGERDES